MPADEWGKPVDEGAEEWGKPIPQGQTTPAKPDLTAQNTKIDQMQAENPQPEPYLGLSPMNILKNMGEGAIGMAKGTYQVGKDLAQNPNWVYGTPEKPSTLEKFVMQPSENEVVKAGQDFNHGNPLGGLGHGLASAIPLVGPWAAERGEQMGRRDIGGAVGQGLGTIAAAEAPGLMREGVQGAARKLAPSVMESGISTTAKGRLYNKTPGESVLKETKGLGIDSTKASTETRLQGLGENIRKGYQGTPTPVATKPVVDLINGFIGEARESLRDDLATALEKTRDKIASLGPTTSAERFWKIKSGRGDLINWDNPDPAVQGMKRDIEGQIYHALDSELDRVAPGISEFNDRYSSLKEAYRTAEKVSRGDDFTQRVAGRVARPTGGAAIPILQLMTGHPVKAAASLMIPEAVSLPSARIAAARGLWALGGGERLPLGSIPPPIPFNPPPTRPIRGLLGTGAIRMPPSPLQPIAGSMPTGPSMGGFPETMRAQPNFNYGGSVRGVPGDFAERAPTPEEFSREQIPAARKEQGIPVEEAGKPRPQGQRVNQEMRDYVNFLIKQHGMTREQALKIAREQER